MFKLNEIVLFNKPVNNGEIGLMEKDIFFSLGKYYSKKDGKLISEQELLQIDFKRLSQIKKYIKLPLIGFKKEILIKECKAINELLLLNKYYNLKNYSTIRSMIYYILNSAKACKDKFIYSRVGYDRNDFRIIFTKSNNSCIIEPILLSNKISNEEYLNSLNKEYSKSFEIIDFDKLKNASKESVLTM